MPASTAITPGAAPEPTSVYRYYDRHGLLIYVGITKQATGRNLQHNRNAEWWQHVVRQEVEHYADRLTAARREKHLIHIHRPPFNKQHNGGHQELRAAYLKLVDIPLPEESPVQQYSRLQRRLPLDVFRQDERELILRSRIEHEPLAGRMALRDTPAPIYWWTKTGTPCGMAKRVEVVGSFAYVICEPHRLMPNPVGSVNVTLKWYAKTQHAFVQRLHLNAEEPVVG